MLVPKKKIQSEYSEFALYAANTPSCFVWLGFIFTSKGVNELNPLSYTVGLAVETLNPYTLSQANNTNIKKIPTMFMLSLDASDNLMMMI